MLRIRCSSLVISWFAGLWVAATCHGEARVSSGIAVLYRFDAGSGNVVKDQSGVGEPLDLKITETSKVRWQPGRLQVLAGTQLRSAGPATKLIEACRKSGEITLETWVQPASLQQTGPARIVSVSQDPSNRNTTLGQQGAALEVRLRTTDRGANGVPGVASAPDTLSPRRQHLAYTRSHDGTAVVYIDGKAAQTANVPGDLSNWDSTFPLLVANEATGDRPWLGDLFLVAVYTRALSAEEVRQNFTAGVPLDAELAKKLPAATTRRVDFVKDVQPLLRKHCFECHAQGNEEGGLNLALRSRVLEGGAHGAVLVAGNSLLSPLIHRVAGVQPDDIMPPEGKQLTADEVAVLRGWIDQGADWPVGADVLDPQLEQARAHWAFQRLADVPVPQLPGQPGDNPIDRFVVTQLQAAGLALTEPLDARRLIRRLTFDLTGLPPAPAEVERFVQAASENQDQTVAETVERLLSSIHYGERWGRHWLDVARYADSDGQEADLDRPTAYHYRDFVIRAFNDDLPFDQFVRWQVAGDEYEPANPDALAATGFLTNGPNTVLEDSFLEEERLRNRYNELDDVVSTLGTALLGLTVGCARCHDHKYDAISSREYYRLLAVFHSGNRQVITLPDGGQRLTYRDFGPEPRASWLFHRGDFYDRELEVRLGFPAVLCTETTPEAYWEAARATAVRQDSTFQRRALAEWLTDVEHGGGALLARVLVNRLWQHHFGQGLVRTVDDFGVRSEPPTHPALLEWLARDFVTHGWQIKRLQRQIVTSRVFQQGINVNAAAQQVDPQNKLLWRMRPQRLDAEILRDAMLMVSGTLNLQRGGPGFKPRIVPEAIVARNLKEGGYPKDAQDTPETLRRSVYMFHKRLVPYPLFQAFDRPDLLQSCGRREPTTVAPQALALLNDQFVRDRARDFAKRLLSEARSDEDLVGLSFRIALARDPTPADRATATEFLEQQAARRGGPANESAREQALTDYCQTLFGLNEFIYID